MNRRLKIIIALNAALAAAVALIFLDLDFVSQFAALLVIFVFPASGLVLFRESHAALKIVQGFVYSILISISILAFFILVGIPVQRFTYLAALTASGNAILVFQLLKKREIRFERIGKEFYAAAALVVMIASGLSFWGATRVVPVLQDHDSVMECPAYGLATTLKPYCIETRVPFYLAKGPTAHFIYAFPLVLTGKLQRVKHYYDSAQAVLAMPDPGRSIVRLWHSEFKRWFPQQSERVVVETRTTSIFITLMLALLLYTVLAETSGSARLAVLLSVVFLSLPEIFVRNSYAGYQNISNLFLLLALYYFIKNRESVLIALLLATINQKCVIVLGLAVGSWLLLHWPGLKKAALNKTIVGLVIGMLLLYAYGWVIHPASLLEDQFQRHGVDRLLHQNPIPGMEYPSLAGLWSMFLFNYGALFVLLVMAAALFLFWKRKAFPRETVLLLLIASTALIFSIVDWKMTKHLDLMIPAMMLIMAFGWREALPPARRAFAFGTVALLGLVLLSNVWIIVKLTQDFSWLKVSPIW